jgi:hypothetical protein
MNEDELNVLGSHAAAIVIAAELLAEACNRRTVDDWLVLILVKGLERFDTSNPAQLRSLLERTMKALNQIPKPVNPENLAPFDGLTDDEE